MFNGPFCCFWYCWLPPPPPIYLQSFLYSIHDSVLSLFSFNFYVSFVGFSSDFSLKPPCSWSFHSCASPPYFLSPCVVMGKSLHLFHLLLTLKSGPSVLISRLVGSSGHHSVKYLHLRISQATQIHRVKTKLINFFWPKNVPSPLCSVTVHDPSILSSLWSDVRSHPQTGVANTQHMFSSFLPPMLFPWYSSQIIYSIFSCWTCFGLWNFFNVQPPRLAIPQSWLATWAYLPPLF